MENHKLTDAEICKLVEESGLLLKTIDLNCNKFRGEGLPSGDVTFPQLESLRLRSCRYITDQRLNELLKRSGPQLKTLDVGNPDEFVNISGGGLVDLGLKFKFLENLTLNGCWELADEGLIELLQMSGPALKTLHLNGASITGEGLVGFWFKFPNLENLNLDGCVQITNEGLSEMLRMSGPHLKTLRCNGDFTGELPPGHDLEFPKVISLALTFCPNLTDRGLCSLLDICGQQIESLDLSYTMLSGGALADWIENHPLERLKKLNLERCDKVTRDDVERLSTMLVECEIKVDRDSEQEELVETEEPEYFYDTECDEFFLKSMVQFQW